MKSKSNEPMTGRLWNLRLLFVCALLLVSGSVFAQNDLEMTRLNTSCDTAIVRTWVWFQYGSGPTCPPLSSFTTGNNADTLELKLFYNTGGVWPQYYCESTNTVTFGISSVTTVLKGQAYSINDGDTSLVSSDAIGLCNLTAIQSMDLNAGYSIFPNPSRNTINLRFDNWSTGSMIEVELYNAFGKILLHRDIDENNPTIDISQLPRGIYFIRISSGVNSSSRKIMKI